MDTENKTPEEILNILKDIAKKSPMAKFMKTLTESRKARLDKQRMRYERTHTLIGHIKTGRKKIDPSDKQTKEIVVPVRQFIGWDEGKKYTGEKLRQIRNEQTRKAIEGQTHYADGSPIIRDRLVDLVEAA